MTRSEKPSADTVVGRWLTWPNLITGTRIVGSPGLPLLALMDRPYGLGLLAGILVLTEWLDGFLARRWQADSAIGARLDTVADAVFYTALLAAIVVFRPAMIWNEAIWIAAATGSYLCSWLASWVKFRHLPSYHTWAAKAIWLVVGTGILCLLSGWSNWPFRIAMLGVVLTNMEAILITRMLTECRVNVASAWQLLRET